MKEPDGSLGSVDLLSMHGGCRIKTAEGDRDRHTEGDREREKWVANHWIEVSEDLGEDVAETERLTRMLPHGSP